MVMMQKQACFRIALAAPHIAKIVTQDQVHVAVDYADKMCGYHVKNVGEQGGFSPAPVPDSRKKSQYLGQPTQEPWAACAVSKPKGVLLCTKTKPIRARFLTEKGLRHDLEKP